MLLLLLRPINNDQSLLTWPLQTANNTSNEVLFRVFKNCRTFESSGHVADFSFSSAALKRHDPLCVFVCVRARGRLWGWGSEVLGSSWLFDSDTAHVRRLTLATSASFCRQIVVEQTRGKERQPNNVVKQNKRAFTATFRTFSADQELLCLDTCCAMQNSDKLPKQLGLESRNKKPSPRLELLNSPSGVCREDS